MEDALAPGVEVEEYSSSQKVLILVVMEDALALISTANNSNNNVCLNPCCNGRCTRTQYS